LTEPRNTATHATAEAQLRWLVFSFEEGSPGSPPAHLGRPAIRAHGSHRGLSRSQKFINTGLIRLGCLLGRRWKHSESISSLKAGRK